MTSGRTEPPRGPLADTVPPPSVVNAVRVMWLSAAFAVLATAVLGIDDVMSAYRPESSAQDGGIALLALGFVVVLILVAATVSLIGLVFLLTPDAWLFVVAVAVMGVAVIVLLVLPTSGEYFRRRL